MPEDQELAAESDLPPPTGPPIVEPQRRADEVDGYAAGAVACAFGSFVVPIVLAVAALFLARASELRREQLGIATPGSQNDTLVALARVVAWANIVLVGVILLFLLVGIAAKVAS